MIGILIGILRRYPKALDTGQIMLGWVGFPVSLTEISLA